MKKERLFIIDNMKGILIILTVLGHLLSQCLGHYFETDVAYIFIYLFHMPAFCLLSGFLSKNPDKDRKTCFKNLIIPYILVYTMWYFYYTIVWDKQQTFDLLLPGYAQWYLLSLITWKLITKTFLNLKHPIISSLVIALLAGFSDKVGVDFSLSRTLVFYPFFLIGHYITKENVEKINSYKKIYGIIGLISILIIACIYKYTSLPISMLYARASYDLSNSNNIEGFLIRIAVYIIALIATLSIMNLTTNKKSKLTKIGTNSLMVLILHVYIIRYFTFTNIFDTFNYIETIMFIIIVCPIIVYITSLNIFKKSFDFIIKSINKLLRLN